MGKRFSRIRYLIKTTKAMNINVAEDDNIKAFKAFRAGDSSYEVNAPKRGSSQPASLVPFCVSGYTVRYMTALSGRANTGMATAGVSETILNIEAGNGAATGTSRGRKVAGFTPAKAVVSVPKADAGDLTPKSQITLLEYARVSRQSFTFPFGKQNVAGQQSELEMRAYIYSEAAKGNRSVSFKPERPA